MNYISVLISKWFSVAQSFPMVAADIFFFVLGLLLALKLGTKKTPVYLMISAAVVYGLCSIMYITRTEIFVLFPVFIGAMAFMMFAGNIVGFIIRLIKKQESPKKDSKKK